MTTPPDDLGPAGAALWRSIVETYELARHETEMLRSACRHRDIIDRLESLLNDGLMTTGSTGQQRLHPAVGELRQARIALSRLLLDLGLPIDSGDDGPVKLDSPASKKARAAAKARHDRERRRVVHAAPPASA